MKIIYTKIIYKNIQIGNEILIYSIMKAKEVMGKYKISRNTLCSWVKRGWIKVEVMPSGRYIYLDVKKEDQDEKTK